MKPEVSHHGRVRLYAADSREVLKTLPSDSIDSIITDPPYALVSVVKRFGGENAAPAGYGKDGLYQRASAGFMGETWDTGETAFAAEFWSECLRVLKPGGHVLAMGGTRTYHRLACAIEDAGFDIRDQIAWVYGSGFPKNHPQGDGLGTAIKPAWEPICLARKDLSEKSIKENIARWGVGGLWIDRSRVLPSGRHPANLIHDGSGEVLEAFPRPAGKGESPSRFFYCAKTSVQDRDEGCEHLPLVQVEGGGGTAHEKADAFGAVKPNRRNVHPTVKPTPLMQWMAGLVTPIGGVVLDPFMGSGSTGKAALLGGYRFIGVEREEKYMPVARARIAFAADKEEWWENAK